MRNEIAERIAFSPLCERDLALVATWLSRPHMREWWGRPEEEIATIRAMVEGRDATRPFLFHLEGRPLGYIQVWSLDEEKEAGGLDEAPWLSHFPPGTVGVDLSIGEPEWLSRGIGSAALGAFVAKLRAEGRERIVIDPHPANRRAVRAYEKAGFRIVPALEGLSGGALIMEYDPAISETVK